MSIEDVAPRLFTLLDRQPKQQRDRTQWLFSRIALRALTRVFVVAHEERVNEQCDISIGGTGSKAHQTSRRSVVRDHSRGDDEWRWHLFLASLAPFALVAFCLMDGTMTCIAAGPIRLIAFGDSLTAGYMLPESDGFAPKLEAALRAQGRDVTVINAGVSGDTTTGGLARLDRTLGDGADAVILELGANDMLRGVDPKIAEANLSKMLASLQARRIKVLLTGMRASPSLGQDSSFDRIYPTLAKQYGVPLYPFFLDGIIGDRSQHLLDQAHPNARGVDTIVAHIMPEVDALLKNVDPKS